MKIPQILIVVTLIASSGWWPASCNDCTLNAGCRLKSNMYTCTSEQSAGSFHGLSFVFEMQCGKGKKLELHGCDSDHSDPYQACYFLRSDGNKYDCRYLSLDETVEMFALTMENGAKLRRKLGNPEKANQEAWQAAVFAREDKAMESKGKLKCTKAGVVSSL